MPKNNFNNQLQLHFIVLIWGFTAILAALIPLDAIHLVWFRVMIASFTIYVFTRIRKTSLRIDKKAFIQFFFGGILIALHWATFFYAIKISTISITLVTLSSGAIFVALLEPLFGRKKIKIYELLLATLAILGFIIIFKVEFNYLEGIISAVLSAMLIALFSVYNSKLTQKYKAVHIAFYELFSAFLFITITMAVFRFSFTESISLTFYQLLFLIILSTVATAYPFIVATKLLKKMGPFTIVLTNNLEPVYGIIFALLIFGEKEKMSKSFYIGAALILLSVIINSILKIKMVKRD